MNNDVDLIFEAYRTTHLKENIGDGMKMSYRELQTALHDILGIASANSSDAIMPGHIVTTANGTELVVSSNKDGKIRGIVQNTGAEHTINHSDVVNHRKS